MGEGMKNERRAGGRVGEEMKRVVIWCVKGFGGKEGRVRGEGKMGGGESGMKNRRRRCV